MPHSKPERVLKKFWGYDSFRPLQRPIIDAVLSGQDTLALLPTGGGKSICYQVPALCFSGLTVVVSPLIALMQDQVHQLKRRNIPARALHSGLKRSDIEDILKQCVDGKIKLLYISPERLHTDLFLGHLPYLNISLLAVDEAHCISQWGHEFRPSYRQISNIKDHLKGCPILAVTATATTEVAEDITKQLKMIEVQEFRGSFHRENLKFIVIKDSFENDRLLQVVQGVKGTQIIYTQSRFRTAEIARFLQQRGLKALYYHGGLSGKDRAERQQKWLEDEASIMVATNAFGMGVDKSNVRAVIHMDIPFSPEAYYQEAGRAGRDGQPSFAVLIYDDSSIQRIEDRLNQMYPDIQFIKDVMRALFSWSKLAIGAGQYSSLEFDIIQFSRTNDWKPMRVFHAMRQLELSGWIELSNGLSSPSRLRMKTDREDLYRMQLADPQFDVFIKHLLRSYEGLFIDYVRIRERDMARQLEISTDEVKSYLVRLDKREVIDFIPAQSGERITFLQSRPPSGDIYINAETLNANKKRAKKRWGAMKAYIQAEECRTHILLNYFGESMKENCGACDICLGSRLERFADPEKKVAIIKDIQTKLAIHDSLSIRKWTYQYPVVYKRRLLQVLSELESEGKVKINSKFEMEWVDEE